jgi:hypothetical protein
MSEVKTGLKVQTATDAATILDLGLFFNNFGVDASLECANLLALWYFYQSGDKSPHSKEASDALHLYVRLI